MELFAELIARDDTRRPFRVSCERSLPGLLRGLEQLKEAVSAELSELVLLEKGDKTSANCEQESAEDDNDDDDDEEEEDEIENKTSPNGPPAKRTKTRQQ
ncbi:Hypothetical predicted protein [Pelobates cultripes]|uniref:Uncharacterized protein n=1 Tax=Pelobates cultripes TaxID=61616 RepID=A0AAD1TLQ1_PELCU|nr:Hypothetical predicted protein [Pelobates cultripes]